MYNVMWIHEIVKYMLGVWKLTSLKREIERGIQYDLNFLSMIERDKYYWMQE